MDEAAKRQVPGEFRVIRYDGRDFVGDYRAIDYGDPLDERMVQLHEEFGLESVVGGCDTELEAILALKRWVRSRWDHGWSVIETGRSRRCQGLQELVQRLLGLLQLLARHGAGHVHHGGDVAGRCGGIRLAG